MAYKRIPITVITIEDGKEVSREETIRGETTCDFCGKVVTHYENEHCRDCGKVACYDCRSLKIPERKNYRSIYYCPDCTKGREEEMNAVTEAFKKESELEKSLQAIRSEIETAINKFEAAKDRKLKLDKKFADAEKKFKEYQDQVESGNYKSHKEMIRKYRALLKNVPEGSKLAEDIEEEIDAHQTDEVCNVLDKARHNEL